ncbi:hypothetical protein FPRO05_12371 [Fusarium proliferatum]|uniref:Uncharacterized protein n=1 Tax=Gibberella intermedia TaxID=948311 RepID=A0A365N4M5_GIBIN|nr:hypothetical protein FPRO05_12371 [Fusarium proliferatum]
MSDFLRTRIVKGSQTPRRRAYEVPEYMVRELDGHIHPELMATPGSGVVYRGGPGSWLAEHSTAEEVNYDEVYATAVQAQQAMITTANKLCVKKKLPNVNFTVAHSWSEVDQSVSDACKALEALSSEDKALKPGFTGKMKQAFRKLCDNAGSGGTIANLVPTDSYCSILCGGLKIIFKGLEAAGHYREEICNALEEIPFILNDNTALVELNNMDEELHRRVAAIYAAIYALLEVIVGWFLKPSFNTGARILLNPTGFSGKLKERMDTVKLGVQRFTAHVNYLSAERQKALTQQNLSIMYRLDQQSEQMERGFERLETTRIMVLDKVEQFLYETWRAEFEQRQSLPQHQQTPRIETPILCVEDILDKWRYERDLVHQDCATVLRLQHIAGYDVDLELVSTIRFHPRFQSYLTLDTSSLLFVDTRSENPTRSLEMPIVADETFRSLHAFMEEQNEQAHGTTIHIICLSFFCSQHSNFARDQNASPMDLAMSLFLQLIDYYRDFDSEYLDLASYDVNPGDTDAILFVFGALVNHLPEDVVLYLMIDDLKAFAQPAPRKFEMILVMEKLLELHRQGKYNARLKFLFGNSARNIFSDGFFTEAETLHIWSTYDRSYLY